MRSLICTLLSAALIVVSIPEAAPQQAPSANVTAPTSPTDQEILGQLKACIDDGRYVVFRRD